MRITKTKTYVMNYDQGIIKRGEKRFPAGENLFWDLIGQCRMLEADC